MKIVDHDKRRREMAEAAARVIAAEGIESLTTRRLAKELGCSLGVLAHYFPNKEEIVLAAFQWADDCIIERINKAAKGRLALDQFKPLLLQVLPLNKQSDLEWRVRAQLNTYALTHKRLMKKHRDELRKGYLLAADLIRQLQAVGQIRDDIDADETAATVVDIVTGLAMNLLVLPFAERKARVAFIDHYWEALRSQTVTQSALAS